MFVVIGWFGTIAYLLNHIYISLNKHWRKDVYYGGNLVAAIALVVSSFVVGSYQAVFINLFWAFISFAMLANWAVDKVSVSAKSFYIVLVVLLLSVLYSYLAEGIVNIKLLGWSSAFVFTAGYLLFCSKRLPLTPYLLLNAYAATAIMPQLWSDQNIPVFVLEIAWAGISVFGAIKHVSEPHLMD